MGTITLIYIKTDFSMVLWNIIHNLKTDYSSITKVFLLTIKFHTFVIDMEKRKLSVYSHNTSSVFVCHHEDKSGKGIVTFFPFAGRIKEIHFLLFSWYLGSSNPCPNSVHMEPFSSSAFSKKLENTCYYHQDLH